MSGTSETLNFPKTYKKIQMLNSDAVVIHINCLLSVINIFFGKARISQLDTHSMRFLNVKVHILLEK